MSKQKERERLRIKKQGQRSRRLLIGGIALVAFAVASFLFLSSRNATGSNARAISRLSTGDFHSLAFSPTDPETIYFGHHEGLQVSTNGGKDWESTTLANADAMAIALPPSNPQIMYAAGHDVFYKSMDGGKTWESVSTNLPGTDLHGFTVDPDDADRVYAHVVGFGIFGSRDGGKTWTLLSSPAPDSTFNLSIGADADSLYAAAGEAGLWVSQDTGGTWSRLPEVPDAGVIAVTFVRANGRLYISTLGTNAGLYYSEDNGKSWTATELRGTLLAIAISPLDPEHVIAVNDQGEVFASRDSGLTWLGG